MAGTGVVPMSRRALVAFLTGLAADLVATVTAETFDRAVPLRVGGALVDAHFTETASIERTLALLGRELAARTPADAERLGLLQGAVAAGYARALAGPHPARAGAPERRHGRGAGRRGAGALAPPAAPGAARPAHRPAQPHPVLRAARRRAARRDGAGRVLPRSRRVHRGQRHPRTRQGRRPPADRGAPPDRGARRPAPGGPHGRRRVRGPRRARRGRRHAAPGGPGGPGRRASPAAARRPRGRRVGEHRRGARRRRPGRRRADEDGRHHALLGEGRRPQPVRDVRRGPPPQRRRPLRGRGPHARGAGPRRVQPGLPASGAAGRPHRGRGGGARPLDAAGRQAARPRTLRPARRRQRVHRAAGPVGADAGVPARRRVGRRGPGDAPADQRQRGGPATARASRTSTTSPPSSTRPGGRPSCCSSS